VIRAASIGSALALGALLVSGCFRFGFDAPGSDAAVALEGSYAACINGADDDRDGDTDCDDADCAAYCGGCLPGPCEDGFARCVEGTNAVLLCQPDGGTLCPVGTCGSGQTCSGFTCAPTGCTPGDQLCDGNGRWNRCLAAAWVGPFDCPAGEVCDPSQGDSCQPVTCTPDVPFCTGAAERADCTPFGVMDGVPQACAGGGTCTAGACAGPCDAPGACEYLFVELESTPDDDGGPDFLVISNTTPYSGSIEVSAHDSAPSWLPVETRGLGIGGTAFIALPERRPVGSGLFHAVAFRAASDVPLAPHLRDDLAFGTHFSAAYAPWPLASLGTEYRIASWPHNSISDDGAPATAHPGGFAVIASADDTTVTVQPSAPTAAGDGVPALVAGVAWMTTLDDGDVLQVETGADGDDLTGTLVMSSAPVAVVGFHTCASLDGATCDKIAELLPPVARWASDYVVPIGHAGEVVRIIAHSGGTVATVAGAGCVGDAAATLGPGQWLEVVAPDVEPPEGACGFEVAASVPVLVALVAGPAASLSAIRPAAAAVTSAAFGDNPWIGAVRLVRFGGSGVLYDGGSDPFVWVAGPGGASVTAQDFALMEVHRLDAIGGGSFAPVVVGAAGGNGFQVTGWSFDPAGGW